MALGTTNISFINIESLLSTLVDSISDITLDLGINKWSKYKPVRGLFPTGSPYAAYGLNLSDSSWDYLRPNEQYRLGDFRGYEHNRSLAFPSIQCRQSDCTIRTIYPIGNTNYYNLWNVRFFKDESSIIITPSDLGLDSYYFGLSLTVDSTTYYKTYGSVSSVGNTGFQFTVDVSLNDPLIPQYVDCPYGSGTYFWKLILCSTQSLSWTTVAPSNIIDFPAETLPDYTIIKSGSFTVANWIVVDGNSHTFIDYDAPSQLSVVMYNSGGAFTINNPESSWLEVEVWDEDHLVERTAHPEQWVSGSILEFKVLNNFGGVRSGTVTISANGASAAVIIQQNAMWVAPIVYQWHPLAPPTGWTVSNTSYNFNVEMQQLTVSFQPNNLSGTLVPLYIAVYRDGMEKVEIQSSGRDGYQTTEVLNLGESIPTNAYYHIYISQSPINIIPI